MKDLRQIAREDGRYSPDAFQFLYEGLDRAVKLAGSDAEKGPGRHVSGAELLEGMRQFGLEQFGPLTPFVWRSWGIFTTRDWGNIVFLLVDAGMMKRREDDRIEDFTPGYDFDQVFVQDYKPNLPAELGVNPASDEA